MSDLSPAKLGLLLVVALLLFGAKRLPEIGRSLGTGMREFKNSVSGQNPEADHSQPDKLQEIGRSLGSELRELKTAVKEHTEPADTHAA